MDKMFINGVRQDDLTSHAFINLIRNLVRYGNSPSKAHYTTLYELLNTYTKMAQGKLKGRYAFPLGTGLGKTQSIVSWLLALYDCHQEVSVAVCASKVEALCTIKRHLIREGVPESTIGLLHSYKYAEEYAKGKVELPKGFASLPSTQDHQEKSILLASHNRVRGKGGTTLYNVYQGKPRNLLIWDESLLKSDTRWVRHIDILSGIGFLKPRVKGPGNLGDALCYLEECTKLFRGELEAQKVAAAPKVLHLPELTPAQIHDYQMALGNWDVVQALKALLTMSAEPLRVASTQQNDGLITYDIAVPQELESIVVLDASHNIRDLVHLDKTIQEVQFPPMVSYQNVTVHQLRHASGRSKMTKEFRKKQEDRKVSLEIAKVVQGIPPEEGVILFTFKARHREVDFKKVLERDLKAQGIDTDVKIQGDKPRFAWLTWGNETSLSEYGYCSNVIFAGVLHRDYVDLASAIAGQSEDLLLEITNEQVREVERSEIAHGLYQAMSRGSSRIVQGDHTLPMKVWLIHKDKSIREVIQKVMPGLRWKVWKSEHLLSKGKIEQTTDRILDYLKGLPLSTLRVSTSSIRKGLSLKDTPTTFTSAIESVCRENAGWCLDGRSLARVFP